MDTLKLKKAWEVALGPVKGLPMTGIMMYMSGNSLQIFSIMMVFMAFKNPIMGILGTNQAFERFETDTNHAKIVQVKLAYVAMQLLALALGVWKVNSMGLLPWVQPLDQLARLTDPSQNNKIRLASLGSTARTPRVCSTRVIDYQLSPAYQLLSRSIFRPVSPFSLSSIAVSHLPAGRPVACTKGC
jgi:hypothetical protein